MKTTKIIKSITLLLDRLRNNKQVRPEEISKILNKKQIAEIEEHWEYQKSLKTLKRPVAIQKYAEMIRIACFYYAKMEKYHQAPVNRVLSKKFSEKADSAFEKALEFIREAIQMDSELQIWLDRDFRDVRGYCPIGIPRVIGSASGECQNKNKHPYPVLSKRELLIEFLEMALYDLQDHTFDEFMTDSYPIETHSSKYRNYDFSEFKF
jgi:hypothetical protein